MHNSHRTGHAPGGSSHSTAARKLALVLLLGVALVPFSYTVQPAQKLRVGMTAAAFGDPSAARAEPKTATATLASIWDDADWRGWETQVREVQAPPDITAGEPLRVEVHAWDSNGNVASNARVEITWVLPDRQYKDIGRTGPFGQLSSTRTLGTSCCGKRCLVAVTVEDGAGAGYAYSAFEPK